MQADTYKQHLKNNEGNNIESCTQNPSWTWVMCGPSLMQARMGALSRLLTSHFYVNWETVYLNLQNLLTEVIFEAHILSIV